MKETRLPNTFIVNLKRRGPKPKPAEERTVVISISLSQLLVRQLEERAAQMGPRAKSKIIAKALAAYL